jgi:hypothetical protein
VAVPPVARYPILALAHYQPVQGLSGVWCQKSNTAGDTGRKGPRCDVDQKRLFCYFRVSTTLFCPCCIFHYIYFKRITTLLSFTYGRTL